ncbi:MAG: UDP-N-acetylmuramate dehydrogenase [Paludibacteraceae bacterium]|nr:UDP-N-acetylmuramate dehydrogenase [Paludibacteraceae bacterium]
MGNSTIPNTFGLSVTADNFLTFTTVPQLRTILNELRQPFIVVGEASNILFTTKHYKGTVLRSGITGYEFTEDGPDILVTAGSGVHWDDFVAEVVRRNLWGAENLSYIPGTVGASAVQNIGAYGAEAKDIIHTVQAIEIATGDKRIFSCEECQYAYRSSIFKHELANSYVIISVTYRLSRTPRPNLTYKPLAEAFDNKANPSLDEIRNTVIQIRRSKLPEPSEIGSAGSFFMNPVITIDEYEKLKKIYPDIPHYEVEDPKNHCITGIKTPAAWLIDHAGLKGFSIGGASVHLTQPLVLINRSGTATSDDIIALSSHVIDTVKNMYNITLRPEVIFV